MEELELIVQRMIDAGEPEENIAAVIQTYNEKKPKSPVEETADAGPEGQAVSTELPLADTLSVSEKKKLSYKERQDLVHKRGRFAEQPKEQKLDQYRQRLYDTFTLPQEQISQINNFVDNINFDQEVLTIQAGGQGFAGMGAAAQSFVGINPYKKELEEAEATLKKSGESYSEEDIQNEARKAIKRTKVREQIAQNQEEILEEVKSDYLTIPGAIFSTFFGSGSAGMSPVTKYFGVGGEYERVRAGLKKDVEKYGKEKTEEKELLLNMTQANAESALSSMEILRQYEKEKASGKQHSPQELDNYRAVALRVQAQNDIVTNNMERLAALSEEINNIDDLADMTQRSYSNWHIARNRIGATVANLAGGVLTVGDELTPLSIIERAYGLDFSKEENLDMLPEFLRPIAAGVYKGKNLVMDNATKFFFDAAKDITAGVEKRQEISKISGVEDFFEFTLDLFSEQAVNTAITAGVPGAGLAIVSAGAAGQKMNEMNIEMADGQKISPLQYYGAALMTFGAEYLTEKVSLDNFNKLAKVNYKKVFNITNPNYTLDINKITATTALGNWVKSVNQEGTAELAAELINNISDKYLLDKDISLTDGLGEAYLSGAVMSGLGFNAPVLAADLVSAFTRNDLQVQNNKRIKEILNITKEINNISLKLDTDPTAPETIKVLQERLDKLYQQQHEALNQTYKNVDDLSNIDKRSLLDIESYIYKAKRAIDKINSDTNLSKESRTNLINTFVNRIDNLNNKKNLIINSSQYSKEKQKAFAFQQKLIAENGLQNKVEIVEADTQQEAIEKTKEVINNSNLEPEVKKQLIEQLEKDTSKPGFYTHGFTIGIEEGLPITVQMKDNATNGAKGNSTVFSHELGHGVLFAKLTEQGADVISLVNMLEDYARKNIKGANELFDEVEKTYADADMATLAEEKFLALKDVYSKRKDALDLTFRGKLFKAWTILKGKDNRADNEVKNGQDVLDLMTSFVSSFETGEIAGSFKALMEGRLETIKEKTADKKQKGKIKESLVYNASPKSFAQLGERTGLIYLATDKREAQAYADMNRGEVKDIFIDENSVASEQDLISTMQELGIDTTEGLTYELIDPRFEDFYIGKNAMKKVTDALAKKGFKAARYEDGAQVIPGKAESIVVFDKSAISDKKGGIKFSRSYEELKDLPKNFDIGAELDKLGKFGSKAEFQMGADWGKLSEIITETKQFHDIVRKKAIAANINRDAITDEFIDDLKYKVLEYLFEKYDPALSDLGIYILGGKGRVQFEILNAAAKFAKTIQAQKSIDTAAGEVGAVTGAEMMSTEEADAVVELEERAAEEAKELKKPLKDRIKFVKKQTEIVDELKNILAQRVKYRISLFDAAKSKNKFTTDFVRDLHKDLQDAAYEIIMEGMSPSDIIKFEQFLSDNYVDIIDSLTTTYLSRAFPEAVQKKIVGEGWVSYPKWKGAKRGAKNGDVEFWKATEEGPYKGNTSGPQKIRRIKNIRNTIAPALFKDKYIKGGVVQELPTIALAKQIAAEMSLEILVDEIKSDGPIAQALFERQELIRGMASTMAANDVIAQIERPGVKFSRYLGKTSWLPLDNSRNDLLNYLRKFSITRIEEILEGIDVPEKFIELYNIYEKRYNEYLLRDNANLGKAVQENWEKFKNSGFDKKGATHLLKINAEAFYNEFAYNLGLHPFEIDKKNVDGYLFAVEKGITDFIREEGLKAKDKTKFIIDAIGTFQGALMGASKIGFGNNEAIFDYFVPLMREVGMSDKEINKFSLLAVKKDKATIAYDGKPVLTIQTQETKAGDIKNTIAGKPNSKGQITNTIKVDDRNKSAKQDENLYIDYTKWLRKQYQAGQITVKEIAMIGNLLHGSYMRAIGKSLTPIKHVLLYKEFKKDSDYTYEHLIPSNFLKIAFANYILDPSSPENALQKLQTVIDKSGIIIVPKAIAKIIDSKFQDGFGPGFDINFNDPLSFRYFDKEVQLMLKEAGFDFDKTDIQNVNSQYFIEKSKIKKSQAKVTKNNNAMLPSSQQVKGKNIINQQVLDKMAELDKETAAIRFSKINETMLDKQFNIMIEQTTGITSESEYSDARAKMDGKFSDKKWWFIPPTAQDFMGLMYAFVAKGKVGDAQLKWIQRNLINPYARAAQEITRARRAMYRDYDALKKELKIVPKNLKEKIPGSSFTVQHAVRAYIYTQEGHEIPGLTEKEARELKQYIQERPELVEFAEKIRSLLKGTQMAKPRKNWTGGTITTDLLETLNTTKRAEALAEWQANVDIIFSQKNLNKIEALYGSNFKWALENILTRMKTGRNRNYGPDSQVGKWMDWLNSQTGTIMFFNMRSAVLQTISTINFMNWSDNNPFEAAKAFANQKQYWTDFFMLFNSDFLVDRRDGLKMEVNESDIADMAKEGMSFQAIVNKVLKAGFVPTQIADSFAIAAGGAAFYRNRLNRYIKEGMEPDKAAEQAFMDFRETAEESQQSSRPDKISAQQAGNLGRFILAFANTPAQYARLMNRAYLDLKNGRGDAKTNISKIIYYGVAQNLLFNALQQALFAFAFDEDEEEEKEKNEKYLSIANGMFDSVLRGIGVHGAIIATLKNTAIELYKESGKDPYKQEFGKKAVIGLSGIAPPLNSKIRKLYKAGDIYKYNNKEIQQMGWDIDNPALLAGANVISSISNLPTDRAVQKSININDALTEDITTMQRIALFAGWSGWNLKIPKYDRTSQSSSQRKKGFKKTKTGFKKSKFK